MICEAKVPISKRAGPRGFQRGVSRFGLIHLSVSFLGGFLGLSRFELTLAARLSEPVQMTYKEFPERVQDRIRTFPEKIGSLPVWETPRLACLLSILSVGILALSGHYSRECSEWGWCRWGRRNFPIFSLFFVFFFTFLLILLGQEQANCNLLGKWGVSNSIRPRLHQPRSELPKIWLSKP